MKSSYYLFRKSSPFSYVIGGIAMFSIGIIVRSIIGLNSVYAAICILGYIFIIYGLFHLRNHLRFRFNGTPLYRLLLYVYLMLCAIMIIRGYTDNQGFQWISFQGLINFHFFNPTYLLCYLMPFVAMISPREYDFRPLVRWSVILSWILIIAFLLFHKKIMQASLMQSLGQSLGETKAEDYMQYGYIYYNVAIICLCRKYINRNIWLLNSVALIVTLLINLLAARRGNSAISGSLLLLNVYFFIKTFNFRYRLICNILSVVLISGVVVIGSSAAAFSYIQKRGMKDNRSYIDEALINQMDTTQKWFGKGLNGRYYYNLHLSYDVHNGYRYLSETGYYNLILKGGYTFTWAYILIILIPALKGIFQSRNLLLKAIGSLMFLSLLELYPFGHLSFSLKFMVIWMGVAMCMNKECLGMTDEQIRHKYFQI